MRRQRLALYVFCVIVVLALAQLAWWIIFLARIAPDRRSVVMIASEGSVFLGAMLLGVWLIYRSLSEQVRLKHMRATFFAAVTHELRSPLASIRLLLETVAAGRVRDERKVADLCRKMLLDADRLERLVEDLLRAGQLENHALEPVRQRTDLAALARDTLEDARARLFAAGDDVAFEAAGPIEADVDRDLVRSLVLNLIENAAKYTSPPRRVRVRVRATDAREAVIEVEDDGMGLDAEARALVFRPFFRAGDEETRAVRGAGLGLYLVQGIADAHGGRAEAFSEGPGKGTTIRIRLPLAV